MLDGLRGEESIAEFCRNLKLNLDTDIERIQWTAVSLCMLYHNIRILLVVAFLSMQAMTLAHAMDHGEHPHQDCVICEVGTLPAETAVITPPPISDVPCLVTEPVLYDAYYISAAIKPQQRRRPPPRAPPLTQA